MTWLAALWLLATLDAAFIGYRDGAARCARLHKRDHLRQSVLRGVAFGQLAVLIAAAAGGGLLAAAAEPARLAATYAAGAERMVAVYAPYAAVILLTLAVRLVDSVDARSIAAVLVFGPLHLLRPFVVAAGAAWALLWEPSPSMIALVVLVVAMMLGLERFLDHMRRRRNEQRVP
jgi:hypothetical protein